MVGHSIEADLVGQQMPARAGIGFLSAKPAV
jgi:hypothetical protein